MDHQCPKCKFKFRLQKLSTVCGMSNYPTGCEAVYCPICGIEMDSWDAYIGYPVVVSDGDTEFEGLLISVLDNEDAALVRQITGKEYTVELQYLSVLEEA